MRRALRWLAAGLLVTVVALSAAAAWVAGTASGARWALDRALPDAVSVEEVEGRLLGPLRLRGVRIAPAASGLEAEVDRLVLRWSPSRLLSWTLRVDRLALEGVRVTLRSEPVDGPRAPPVPEEVLRSVGRALGAGAREFLPLRLELAELAADGPGVRLRGSGRLDPAATPKLDVRLSGRVPAGDGLAAEGRLWVRGDEERVDLVLSTRSPVVARLEGAARDLSGAPAWSLDLRLEEFATEELLPALPAGRLGLAASARDTGAGPAGTLRAAFVSAELGRVTADAALALEGDTLRIGRLEVGHPGTGGRVEAAGAAWLRAGAPTVRTEGRWTGLRWPLRGEPGVEAPSGTFRLEGRPDSLRFGVEARLVAFPGAAGPWRLAARGGRAEGRLDAELEGRGPLEAAGEVSGEAVVAMAGDSVHLRRLGVLQAASGARLSASGAATIGGPVPTFRLRAGWEAARWPVDAETAVESPEGRLTAGGTSERFGFRVDASVAAPGAPPATVSAAGERRPGTVELSELRARVLGGTATGRARWTRAGGGDEVSASIEAAELDPSEAWPGWPGDLSFRLSAEARSGEDGPAGALRLADLSGTLRGRPLGGEARLRLSDGAWRLDTLRLRSGEARLTAAGAVGDRWEGSWALDASRLEDLAPGLGGRLAASGAVQGPRARPEVTVSAGGSSLSAGGVEAGSLAVELGWTGGLDGEGRIEAEARSFSAAGLALDSMRLDATGAEGRHTVRLGLVDGETRLTVRAGGRVVGDTWTGAVDTLTLATSAVGRWDLASPVRVLASRDSLRVEHFCWTRGPSSACLEAGWSREEGVRWAARGAGLPLGFAGPWLPAGLEVLGEFELDTRGRVPPGGRVEGHLRIGAGDGELRMVGGSEAGPTSRRIDSLRVALDVDRTGLRGGLRLTSGERDSLRVEAEVGPPEAGGRRIGGRLAAGVSDDGLAGALLEPLASTRGRLVAAASLGGTTEAPALDGTVEVLDAGADVVPAGLELRDVALRLTGDGSGRLEVAGRAASGEGTLTLEGRAALPGIGRGVGEDASGPASPLDLRVRGHRFLVQNTRAVRLLVSPDLAVAGGAEGIRVSGELRVPEARVSVRRIEAAVPASSDVTVIGREGRDVAQGGGPWSVSETPVSVDVDVVLGDRVTVDAYGVRGRLTGRVAVSGRRGRPPTGRGQIELVEGRYTALRRDLPLDHGRLVFAGSPVDDPGLDVRVVRRTAGVEVGLQIGGTARSPRVTLFSSPPMAEADLLSYLLFGRPAAAVNPAEGQLLTGAARTLGFVGGDILVSRLGAALALDEVRLEEEEDGGAALVLGRRLSPRLELGYAIGLFGAGDVLTLIYRLGRGWVVRAESGAERGADLLYIIER